MDRAAPMTPTRLRTPRAAAIAGIVFSVLLALALALIRLSVPADAADAGAWLSDEARRRTVGLALNLVPFAGIAFLWFIGVIRDRIGTHEDRFFATVFLGSGLLFVAMLFAAAAVAGGLLSDPVLASGHVPPVVVWGLERRITFALLNVYAMRMAGVFIISTTTIGMRTGVVPRWLAVIGYVAAAILLLGGTISTWVNLVLPAWALVLSVETLVASFRADHARTASA
ncbi:MAG: hypothetical protein ACM3OO_14265 [Planctomycetaceae bacterium]